MSTQSAPATAEPEHTKGVYKCQHCPKVYKVYSSYWAHNRVQHKGFRYKCPSCKSASFQYPYSLLKHRLACKGGGANTVNAAPVVASVPYTGTNSFAAENPWLS